MWTCSLLKTNAKQALRGRYWRCFWICLVLGLVGVGGSSASTGGSRYTMDTVTGSDTAYDRVANYLDSLSYQMLMTILVVAVLAAVISLLWSIFVTAPLEVGRDRYFMPGTFPCCYGDKRIPHAVHERGQGTVLEESENFCRHASFCGSRYLLGLLLRAGPLSTGRKPLHDDHPRHAVEQRHYGR